MTTECPINCSLRGVAHHHLGIINAAAADYCHLGQVEECSECRKDHSLDRAIFEKFMHEPPPGGKETM